MTPQLRVPSYLKRHVAGLDGSGAISLAYSFQDPGTRRQSRVPPHHHQPLGPLLETIVTTLFSIMGTLEIQAEQVYPQLLKICYRSLPFFVLTEFFV